jgi:gamma-glutamylcysteine synthetase
MYALNYQYKTRAHRDTDFRHFYEVLKKMNKEEQQEILDILEHIREIFPNIGLPSALELVGALGVWLCKNKI